MPPTSGTESGLWQTPSVEDAGRQGSAEAWREWEDEGRTTQCRLRNQAQMWPTPTGQDAENNAGPSQFNRNSLPLNTEVGGSLNPNWVEWLMGYPVGWTDLDR
ncbi:MAG: hypothetical protein WC763_07150 [Candidatus Paceibacterota bacterium]